MSGGGELCHTAAPSPCASPGMGAAPLGASLQLPLSREFSEVFSVPSWGEALLPSPSATPGCSPDLPCAWVTDPGVPHCGDAHPAVLDLSQGTIHICYKMCILFVFSVCILCIANVTQFLARANFPSLWFVPSTWLELHSLDVSPWRCPWALHVPQDVTYNFYSQQRLCGAGCAWHSSLHPPALQSLTDVTQFCSFRHRKRILCLFSMFAVYSHKKCLVTLHGVTLGGSNPDPPRAAPGRNLINHELWDGVPGEKLLWEFGCCCLGFDPSPIPGVCTSGFHWG